jgi:serine/threonine-protein kinase
MVGLAENMVVADRFRLVRMIGRGGMGSVWEAADLRLSTTCAVKFIEGELARLSEAHSRFQREAQAAAQLRSPNVVQIFDHGVWEGHPYIAMELLDGEDLGKRLAGSGGQLEPADVNFVVQHVCRALTRAHQAGFVHRDLKPDNIFVVRDDDRDIVKILDFGVAKSTAHSIEGSNTKTGAMLGTPYYMSPEQAQGTKSVDGRSDLWSLAVIVFQCLTGRLPFESEALGDLLVKIIVAPIPIPSQYHHAVPLGFDGWWARAANRDPDKRYQTAKEFAEALSLTLGHSTITEVTERSRLHRGSERPGHASARMAIASGTAVLGQASSTPQPVGGAQTALLATPHPSAPTPPGALGYASQPRLPGQASGSAAQAPVGAAQASTGGVAGTYPGLEAAGLPAKRPPVAVLVGLGLFALVGLGLGGVALLKGRSAPSASAPASTSAAAALTATAASPGAASAQVTASPSETASPSVASASAAVAPAASASSSAPGSPGARTGSRGPVLSARPSATAPTTGPVAASARPAGANPAGANPAGANPAGTKEKPLNLGF